MRTSVSVALLAGVALPLAAALAQTAPDEPRLHVKPDQNLTADVLSRYHFTDQGNRLIPAAWLTALDNIDGSGKVMDKTELRRLGFIVDGVEPSSANPRGWPVGFTTSDPKMTGGIPIAGLTCAACHTGQVEFKGTAIRIEGGQSMIDLGGFTRSVFSALAATARDPVRRERFFVDAVQAGYPAERVKSDFEAAIGTFGGFGQSPPGTEIRRVVAGRGRYDAVQGIANQVFSLDLGVPTNVRDLNAPVSYPYLWDIWRLSWLQYNAFLPPAATSRNIGEVLGTRAITHMIDPRSGSLNPEPLRWQTSIQLQNIMWMEDTLEGLKAPMWPAEVLGAVNVTKAERGRALFNTHCAGCHGIKEMPNGNWDVTVVPLERLGTDPLQATNWAGRTYDGSKLGLSQQTGAYQLDSVINAIRRQLYVDNKVPIKDQEGDVRFEAPCGYKARPLIGTWATPPFLHNGSVRTVYDLLSETRPATFRFGTREYDPVKLGYTEDAGLNDLTLDTTIPGNSNKGHWWTDEIERPGRIGPRLSEDEKFALIEYLKAATYETYPREKRVEAAQLPCQSNRDWAVQNTLPKQ